MSSPAASPGGAAASPATPKSTDVAATSPAVAPVATPKPDKGKKRKHVEEAETEDNVSTLRSRCFHATTDE